MRPDAEWIVDRRTGLALPFQRCSKCNSERFYRDLRNNLRCMTCVPPHMVMEKLRQEKLAAIAREQRAVNDFIDEDEDIQDYNYRHFGQRTS